MNVSEFLNSLPHYITDAQCVHSALANGVDPRQMVRDVVHGFVPPKFRDLWIRGVDLFCSASPMPERLYLHSVRYAERYDIGWGSDVTTSQSKRLPKAREHLAQDVSIGRFYDCCVAWRLTRDDTSHCDAVGIVGVEDVERISR